eukprot:SAG11_NODE_394_length_9826_cov_3.333607_4_plen_254_part_00
MKYFVSNLLFAMLVDGFSISDEEKLVKQEKRYIDNLREESKIVAAAGATSLHVSSSNTSGKTNPIKARSILANMAKGARGASGKVSRLRHDLVRHMPGHQGSKVNEREELSWGFIALDTPFRRMCIAIAESTSFSLFVWVTISLSSVAMAAEGPPGLRHDKELTLFFSLVNVGTLVVFWVEFVIKTVSTGFAGPSHPFLSPYLSMGWNRFDFFVVLSSTIEFLVGNMSAAGNMSRITRVLRVSVQGRCFSGKM